MTGWALKPEPKSGAKEPHSKKERAAPGKSSGRQIRASEGAPYSQKNRSAFGEVFDVLGEFFDFVRFFDEGDRESRGGVGGGKFLFEFRDEAEHLVDVGTDGGLILLVDGFWVDRSGNTAAFESLRSIGVGGRVRRRNGLWVGLMGEKEWRGGEESSECGEGLQEMATRIEHKRLRSGRIEIGMVAQGKARDKEKELSVVSLQFTVSGEKRDPSLRSA